MAINYPTLLPSTVACVLCGTLNWLSALAATVVGGHIMGRVGFALWLSAACDDVNTPLFTGTSVVYPSMAVRLQRACPRGSTVCLNPIFLVTAQVSAWLLQTPLWCACGTTVFAVRFSVIAVNPNKLSFKLLNK